MVPGGALHYAAVEGWPEEHAGAHQLGQLKGTHDVITNHQAKCRLVNCHFCGNFSPARRAVIYTCFSTCHLHVLDELSFTRATVVRRTNFRRSDAAPFVTSSRKIVAAIVTRCLQQNVAQFLQKWPKNAPYVDTLRYSELQNSGQKLKHHDRQK